MKTCDMVLRLFSVVVVLAPIRCVQAETGESERPNILWITCEDISPNLGCYGDTQALTPNLDQLAAHSGRYGSRNTPFEGVSKKLHARAIAMRLADEKETTCVLVSVDSIGVPEKLTTRIAGRLQQIHGISRDRFVLCSTHSHVAPQIDEYLTNHFTIPLTAEEQAEVKRYTSRLEERVMQAVTKAIKDLAPGTLFSSEGQVGFAVNRRLLKDGRWSGFGVQEDGSVDHSLPVLKVIGADKKLRGLVFNYACHCTTLGPNFNQVNGDWAGYADLPFDRPSVAEFKRRVETASNEKARRHAAGMQ